MASARALIHESVITSGNGCIDKHFFHFEIVEENWNENLWNIVKDSFVPRTKIFENFIMPEFGFQYYDI